MYNPLRSHRRQGLQRWISLLAVLAAAPAVAQDYTAVRIEAENFSSRNSDWHITSPSAIPSDPVDPFHQNASGDSYMELLPDTRVTHDDDILQGQNFWGGPGAGPALHYNIDIPQPGRYIIYAKAYSTGTEDNGIHVGINSTTPESGHRLQWCNGKHTWTWSSAQRTDAAHCGVPKMIYLDIASAGQNTITFWAREDGFELDQFILLKEDHDGSLNCFPTANDSIRCENATTAELVSETYLPVTVLDQGNQIDTPADSDGLVDLSIAIEADDEFTNPGQVVTYTVTVWNNDVAESATGVVANITLDAGLQFNASENCVLSGATVSCSLAEILAGQNASQSFTAIANTTGTLFVDATMNADQTDDRISNNNARHSVVSNQPVYLLDAALDELTANSNIVANGSSVKVSASISNLGSDPITDAQLAITLPADASLTAGDTSCDAGSSPCLVSVPAILAAQRATIVFTVTTGSNSDLALPVEVQLNGDEVSSNNTASLTIDATDNAARVISVNGIVSVEAEQFSSASPSSLGPADGHTTPAWSLFSGDTDASAQAYMSVLPDSRSSETAPAVSGASNFSAGGSGPTLAYPVIFEQAGRYFLHVRMRADNSQNATLHAGLNNVWPVASTQITVCDPDNQWQWATTAGDCTAESPAYIDVATPGEQLLQLSAATDGSQIDKILLTTDAAYLAADAGPDATIFIAGNADVELIAELSSTSVELNESSTLTLRMSNLSTDTAATGISVSIDGIDPALADSVSGFDYCQASDSGVICQLATIAAGAEHSATIDLALGEAADMPIDMELLTLSSDTDQSNNSAAVELKVITSSGGGGLGISALLIFLILGLRRRNARG